MSLRRLVRIGFTAVLILTSFISFTSNTNPPVPYAGVTGENNCTSCHSGSTVNPSTNLTITGLPANGYTPGQSYSLTVNGSLIASTAKNGFEMTCTKTSSTTTMAGTLTGGSGVGSSVSGGKTYLYHSSNATNSWNFTWVAPVSGTGSVTFFICYVASNNNNNQTGDAVNFAQIQLNELANLPTAVITASKTSVCLGDTIYLSGSGANSPTSYTWTSTNGTSQFTSTQQNTYIVYTTAGSKSMKLTTANANGSASSTVTLFVNARPNTPTITASNSYICAGDSISLSNTTTGVSYLWLPDNKTTSSIYIKDSVAHTLKVTNTSQCSSTSVAFKAAIRPKPTVTLVSSKDTTCMKDSVLFTAGGTATSYSLYVNDTLRSTLSGTSANALLLKSGANTTYFKGTLNGCTVSSTPKSVYAQTVLSTPVVNCGTKTANSVQFTWNALSGASTYQVSLDSGKTWITANGNLAHTIGNLSPGTNVFIKVRGVDAVYCGNGNEATAICSNQSCPSVTMNITHANKACFEPGSPILTPVSVNVNSVAAKYFLQIKDSLLLTNGNSADIKLAPGLNTVHIRYIDSANISCPVDTSFNMMAYEIRKPILSINKPNGVYCYYDTDVQMKAGKALANDSMIFRVYDPSIQKDRVLAAGLDSMVIKPTMNFNTGLNNVTAMVISAISGCTSISAPVPVNRVLQAGATYTATAGTPATDITFTDNTPQTAQVVSRLWVFGDNAIDTNKITVKHSYAKADTYTTMLLVKDIFGCKDSATKSITVQSSGIAGVKETNFTVYPNPFHEVIELQTEQASEVRYWIMDITGRIVQEGHFTNKAALPSSDWKAGTYIVRMQQGDAVYVSKLIRE